METRRNHFRSRFRNCRGRSKLRFQRRPSWDLNRLLHRESRHHEREPRHTERKQRNNYSLGRAYNGEDRDRSFPRSPSRDTQRSVSPGLDNNRMVNRERRSVSPDSGRDRIVRLKYNFLDKEELSGRSNHRTARYRSPNRRYESQEEDRYSESSSNGYFTQNHSSYRSYRDDSSRHERYDERYTPERSYRNNNGDIRYERNKHDEKELSEHGDYRQRDSDTSWNRHVDKYQSSDRRRRDNYYDCSDKSDDRTSSDVQIIYRRDKPFVKPAFGGRTIDNGENSSEHRNMRPRQADSESAASNLSTDETRQLEDGEIRSPSIEGTENASVKQERRDLSPVSNESINSTFDQFDQYNHEFDTDRPYTTTNAEASIEDENEYLVKQQPDAFTKKYTLTLDTLELLKTLTDELEQEIAADIMSILLCAGKDLSIETLCDKLKEKNIFFELITLENFLEGKFKVKEAKLPLSSDIPAGTKCVVPFTNIRLCMHHSNRRAQRKCNCNDLHICKFFLLSTCPNGNNCKFGHKLKTDHNIRVSKMHFLHRLTLKQIKNFIRQKDNRNRTTTPEICKFYNTERGCKHGSDFDSWSMCQYLNICRFYISNSCKFGDRCKRSHDLLSGQPRKVLSLYGLEPDIDDQYSRKKILAMLNGITKSSDEVTQNRPKDRQMPVNDTKRMDGELAMRLPSKASFISLVAPTQDRYFSQHLSDSTSYSKGCDSSLDISGDSTTVSSEEETDSETEADGSKKYSSLELAKTNDLKSRKRNLTTDTDDSAGQAKIPKLTDVDENSDAVDNTISSLSLQAKDSPIAMECIGFDTLKTELSFRPLATIDADTVKTEISLKKKELLEAGTMEKVCVDTIKTDISSQTNEFPSPMDNVDVETTKKEMSSQLSESFSAMYNCDADTISMERSFQTNEVADALETDDVDSSTTELPLQTSKSPDRCKATVIECDSKSEYDSADAVKQPDQYTPDSELNVSTNKTGSTEHLQATSDITADQEASDTEFHCQNSWPSPSEIKQIETADIKEETGTESAGQEPNPGEDTNRKEVAGNFGWRLTEKCETNDPLQDFPFRALEEKYQQFMKGACCEIKFQDKRMFFNFKTMDGKILTQENEEIEIQLEREPES